MNFIKKITGKTNSKFIYLNKSFKNSPFKLLDVGVGNHSPTKTTFLFPNCEYYGVDIDKNYNNDADDFKVMKEFYEMDLTELNFQSIPDEYFDGIWMAHVIEHLYNGDKVIENLIRKLKHGGYMYIEYPGLKSTKLPPMNESLNFYDDKTHVRIFSVKELTQLFNSNGCMVLKAGTRRNIYFLIATPFRILYHWVKGKKLVGNIFWDLLGFAEYIYIRKN